MLSVIRWLFDSPVPPEIEYYRARLSGAAEQLAQMQAQTPLNMNCTALDVGIWLNVNGLEHFICDLVKYDGPALLTMSEGDENELRSKLAGKKADSLFLVIAQCRRKCGAKRKLFGFQDGVMYPTNRLFERFSTAGAENRVSRAESYLR